MRSGDPCVQQAVAPGSLCPASFHRGSSSQGLPQGLPLDVRRSVCKLVVTGLRQRLGAQAVMRESHGAGRSGTSSWAAGSPFQDRAEKQQEEVSSPGDSELALEALALFRCRLAQALTLPWASCVAPVGCVLARQTADARCALTSLRRLLGPPSLGPPSRLARSARVPFHEGLPACIPCECSTQGAPAGGPGAGVSDCPLLLGRCESGGQEGVPSASCKPSRPVPALPSPVPRVQSWPEYGREAEEAWSERAASLSELAFHAKPVLPRVCGHLGPGAAGCYRRGHPGWEGLSVVLATGLCSCSPGPPSRMPDSGAFCSSAAAGEPG